MGQAALPRAIHPFPKRERERSTAASQAQSITHLPRVDEDKHQQHVLELQVLEVQGSAAHKRRRRRRRRRFDTMNNSWKFALFLALIAAQASTLAFAQDDGADATDAVETESEPILTGQKCSPNENNEFVFTVNLWEYQY